MAAVVSGEIVYVRDDGTLTYDGIALLQDIIAGSGGGGGVSDGDKGDITVSGAGTVWTIDAGAVAIGDVSGLVAALAAKLDAPAALNDLSDVVITAPATNEVLAYDGANWVNVAATAGGSAVIGWVI
jgi:hypothetical protein